MKRILTFLVALFMVVSLVSPAAAAQPVKVLFDDAEVEFDEAPFVEEGRTLVPIRALAEKLGFTVDWLEAEQKITLTKGETTIVLWIGSNKVLVNGVEGTIDVPAKKVGNRTFVPIRFIAETLGTHVGWDNDKQAAVVTSGSKLAEKAMAAQTAPGNMKQSADITMTMKMAGEGMPGAGITMDMKMKLDAHMYNNEMYMQMMMNIPFQPAMTMEMAGLNGKLWQKTTAAGQTQAWTEAGPFDPTNLADLSSLGGTLDMMKLQSDIMAQAVTVVNGTEEVDGVNTAKVTVDLSKVDMQSMIDQILSAAGLGAQAQAPEMKIKLNRYIMTYWINPATNFVHKMDMDMDLSMDMAVEGQQGSMQMIMKGLIKLQPTDQPIKWPADLPR